MYVLGIDVGATKTVCLLADLDGTVVATAREGGANLQAVGERALETVLKSVIEHALAGRGIIPSAICLGIAGLDRAEDEALVRRIMGHVGVPARALIVNDALIALVAGVHDAPGIVIVAGTGSIAYGRNAAGHAARAGGWGPVLSDEGSGYWIGRHALRAVVRHADGRGPATTLTPRLLAHFEVLQPEHLIQKVYRQNLGSDAIAAVVAEVQAACDDGDMTASEILMQAAAELLVNATAVTARLHLAHEAFTFVLSGGVFRGASALRDRLTQLLPTIAAASTTLLLEAEPALGAVRLAIAEMRGGARVPVYLPHR